MLYENRLLNVSQLLTAFSEKQETRPELAGIMCSEKSIFMYFKVVIPSVNSISFENYYESS